MAPQFITLSANQPSTKLATPFTVGHTVVFTSTQLNAVQDNSEQEDHSSINITRGNDILLTISIRRDEQEILMDASAVDGDKWQGNYEVVPLQGLFVGGFPTIAITNTATAFIVSFDNQKANSFKHRSENVGTGIQYLSEDIGDGIFSNPIYATVFTTSLQGVPLLSQSTSDPNATSSKGNPTINDGPFIGTLISSTEAKIRVG